MNTAPIEGNYFHRFLRSVAALSNMLTLTFILWTISVTTSVPDSAGEMILASAAAAFRAVASRLRSTPDLA